MKNKTTAVGLTISLVSAAVLGLGFPAKATTASNPTIIFAANGLAATVPPTETATRVSADSLALSTASLSRTTSTSRAGYTFGGWSLAAGEAVTTAITTATTSDTTRTIHAVWNTTLTYNLNGATSGLPTGNATTTTYRYGQALTLPTIGTMVRSGFALAGWMTTTVSTNRFTTFTASADAVGNPTLYAAWIKTVSFNANSATTGTVPVSQVFVAGETALKLPVLSEMTLRKPGYDFMGWSATATGAVVSNPASYTPITATQTLYAIWKIQSSQATSRVFFKTGASKLLAGQKLIVRDLADSLRGKTTISIKVNATRPKTAVKRLGKARNTSVVQYLRSLGVVAVFERQNKAGAGKKETAKKNNRVTVMATWSNPA
jgi:uncharacterized repeat protein (TIGR02543 family)